MSIVTCQLSHVRMDIYAQNILDRYKEPFYKDKDIKANARAKETNHSCGDKLTIKLEIRKSKIENYSFTGVGCAISQASADILGDLVIGHTIDDILNMGEKELLEALGIDISERRMKCALLGLVVIQKAIKQVTK